MFIVNPVSGGYRPDFEDIVKKYVNVPYQIAFTRCPGHAAQLAAEASAEIVVAVGGDGTVNEVAGALAGSSKTLGIIPCGSGNGLAFHLGIRKNMRKSLETIVRGRTQSLDAARIGDRLFFCTCGLGLDADVAMLFSGSKTRGLFTYVADALRVWKNFEPRAYDIIVDGKEYSCRAALVTVGNANQWGNNAFITPRASISDGLLDVTVVKAFSTLDIPSLAFALMTGHIDSHRKSLSLRGKEIIVRRQGHGAAHYDGEAVEMGAEITVSVCPGVLRVLVP